MGNLVATSTRQNLPLPRSPATAQTMAPTLETPGIEAVFFVEALIDEAPSRCP